jgi:outer membrane lipoprotein-sorting protein
MFMKRVSIPALFAFTLSAAFVPIAPAAPAASSPAAPAPAVRAEAAASAQSATSLQIAASAQSTTEAVALLRRLEKAHADHRRADGKFTQVRVEDPVFLEKSTSIGQFYYERPNRFWCHYDRTNETHWVMGDMVYSYFPKFQQVERYRLRTDGSGISDINHMLLAFGVETDRVLKHFVVRDEPSTAPDEVRLAFIAKAPPQERPFERFTLALTRRELQPLSFEILGPEGEKTVIAIDGIRWNPPEDPRKFKLQFPKGTEIIEPAIGRQ